MSALCLSFAFLNSIAMSAGSGQENGRYKSLVSLAHQQGQRARKWPAPNGDWVPGPSHKLWTLEHVDAVSVADKIN